MINRPLGMSRGLNNVLMLICIVFILYVSAPLLMPIMFALLFATVVFPVVRFLEKKLKFPQGLSSLCGVLLVSAVIVALTMLVVHQFGMFSEDKEMYISKFKEMYGGLISWFQEKVGVDASQMKQMEKPQVSEVLNQGGGTIASIFGTISGFLGDLLMFPLFMFFILFYRAFLIEFVFRALHYLPTEKIEAMLSGFYDVVQNYLRGLLIVMAIVGALNSVALLLLGVENAFFFGYLAALLLLIPYIGVAIGSLLPALVALVTKDSYWYSVGVIASFAFIQIVEANVITPNITGGKISMNAFISILSFFIFGMLWGMAGLVLALPVTAMLKVIFDNTENLKAWGFLIGETEKYHTKKHSMDWMKLRIRYRKSEEDGPKKDA